MAIRSKARWFWLAVALALSLLASGCLHGADEPTQGEAGSSTVTMWVFPLSTEVGADTRFWSGIARDFESRNPNIKVRVEVQPWENREQKLATAIAGGVAPDVLYVNEFQIPSYVERRYLKPLNQDFTLRDFYPNAVDALTYEDKLYAVPLLQTLGGTVFNLKLFRAAGVRTFPTTWKGILQIAPEIKKAGFFTMQYDALQSLNLSFYNLLWQAGGDVLSPDGKRAAFNGPAGVRALSFVRSMVRNGHIAPDGLTEPQPNIVDQSMAAGKVAINPFMYSSEMGALVKSLGKGNVRVGPPLQDTRRVMYGANAGFAMLATAKDVEATVTWIRYITGPKVMRSVNRFAGFFAPRKTLGDLHENDPLVAPFAKFQEFARAGVKSQFTAQIESVLMPELQAVLLGKEGVQAGLNDAADEVDTLLRSRG